MVRRLSLLAGVVLLASLSVQAQGLDDKFEVFGGYSYLRVNNSPSANLNGWELSGNYKFAEWLGGVADFDGRTCVDSPSSFPNGIPGPMPRCIDKSRV